MTWRKTLHEATTDEERTEAVRLALISNVPKGEIDQELEALDVRQQAKSYQTLPTTAKPPQ